MSLSPCFRVVMLRLIILLLLTLLCSCAHQIDVRARHVVMFDENSRLLDPTGNTECTKTSPGLCEGKHLTIKEYKPLDEDQQDVYVRDLLKGLRDAPEGTDGKKHLIIFVHGGLNTQTGSVKRAAKLASKITDARCYPIFLNWRSSLSFSYFNHLLYIRQGEEWNALAGWLSSPVVLAYDTGRGLFRAPLVWASQVNSGIQTLRGASLPHDLKEREEFLKNDPGEHPGEAIGIVTGEDKRSNGEVALSDISGVLLFPVRMITSPFIDSFGSSAWDNMLRQTRLLTHTMDEYGKGHPNPEKPKGDLALIMEKIKKEVLDVRKEQPGVWEVVLVGHSMGAIVINELLRAFPDFPVDTIVYMAAASSVTDFEQSVIPYLRRNASTKFYNLTLHHMAEEGERNYWDLVMRGSLLNWIDDFFANPMTPKEKTLGQYVNFLRTEQIFFPGDVRGRVNQKEFSYSKSLSKTDPQKHGDFDRCPFWDKRFYSLEPSAKDPKLVCSDD